MARYHAGFIDPTPEDYESHSAFWWDVRKTAQGAAVRETRRRVKAKDDD